MPPENRRWKIVDCRWQIATRVDRSLRRAMLGSRRRCVNFLASRRRSARSTFGGHRPPLQKQVAVAASLCRGAHNQHGDRAPWLQPKKGKCRSPWRPAFSRCAAKTELCAIRRFSEPRLLSLSRSSRHTQSSQTPLLCRGRRCLPKREANSFPYNNV